MKQSVRKFFILAGLFSVAAHAEQLGRNFEVSNRFRVEYDDNIYDSDNDAKEESLKIMDEIEFIANLNFEKSYVGFRYRPSFVWWENREPDDTDLHHDLELQVNHSFTPRLALGLKETYRLGEQPELIDRGTTVRRNQDFVYNVADGSLSYVVRPDTRLEFVARNTILRYEDDDVAKTEDYDINAGGLSLRHEFNPRLSLAADARVETTDYDNEARGAESEYLGLGLDRTFSPNLLGGFRAGVQLKQFDDSMIDDETAPYFDANVTVLPSPRTRVTLGLGHSMFESDYYPYANQYRTVLYANMAHDLTARIALYASASYQMGEYEADQTIESTVGGEAVKDAEEGVTQLSVRGSYKINRNNSVDASLNHVSVDGELPGRDDFDRNRVSVGWRTQI